MDYQKSEEQAVSAIKKAIPTNLKKNMLSQSKGMFCELYENDEVFPNHIMGCAIDSVGTKVVLAEAMQKYDTIGIDCVAMSANDLATYGKTSPFLFIDCLSVQSKLQEEQLTTPIIKGIVTGLEECDASSILRNSISLNFGKGETASVHELLDSPSPGYGFDLVGGMIGFLPKSALEFNVTPGQKIIALPSSGLHSNGYTDARYKLLNGDFESREEYKKHYTGKYSLDADFEGSTIGETLLSPTTLYVKAMAKITNQFPAIGINNTGYGLKNLNRLKGAHQFVIDSPLPTQPIFDLIQQEAPFSDEQMYTKFNMGSGFFIITDAEHAEDAAQLGNGQVVGEVQKAPAEKTILHLNGKKLEFSGY